MRLLSFVICLVLMGCDKPEENSGNTRSINKISWQGDWAFVPDTVMLYCDPDSHAVAVLYPPDTENEQVYTLNDEARAYAKQWRMPWQDVAKIGNGRDVTPFVNEALKLCDKED